METEIAREYIHITTHKIDRNKNNLTRIHIECEKEKMFRPTHTKQVYFRLGTNIIEPKKKNREWWNIYRATGKFLDSRKFHDSLFLFRVNGKHRSLSSERASKWIGMKGDEKIKPKFCFELLQFFFFFLWILMKNLLSIWKSCNCNLSREPR